MELHVERMHEEYEQLSERVEKLASFIDPRGLFGALDYSEQMLLNAQLAAMRAYQYVLLLRLERAR